MKRKELNNGFPRIWGRVARSIAASVSAGLLTGCTGDFSTLDPAGPAAASIAKLWWIMLTGSVVIFLATTLVLIFAWARPSALGTQAPRNLILWGGLVLPSLILTTLVFSSFAIGERIFSWPHRAALLHIEAEASQWQWTFRSSSASFMATTDTLHIPVGREIDFTVTSTDVIHSFWIPRLGGKIDAIPGHRNTIRLYADTPGRYGGLCAEFCGAGHASMSFSVEAHTPEDYEKLTTPLVAHSTP